ncbi:SUKH-4 family immunity protein [Deinococcus roseus]|nr:SUKH-4 family immunity protein [Deinococcus roseus]
MGPFTGFGTAEGLSPDSAPDGISRVRFTLKADQTERELQLLAGCLGITQDPSTLHIKPLLGWAISPLSEVSRGNSEAGEKRSKMDLQDLQKLGVTETVLRTLSWLEDITCIGSHKDWFFLLEGLQDHGDRVQIARGKQGRVLLHKHTGAVEIADPAGKVWYANQDFSAFCQAVDVFQQGHLEQEPAEQAAMLQTLVRALQHVDATACADPQHFWSQVLQNIRGETA